jgi:tyrosyl-tRNA synthetase
MPLEQIAKVMKEHRPSPEKRVAQHLLAQEFLELAHGTQAAMETADEHRTRATQRRTISIQDAFAKANAEAKTSARVGADPRLNVQSVSLNPKATPSTAKNTHTENMELDVEFLENATFPAVLQAVGLVNSKSEGQRLITNRGAYVARYKSALQDNLEWSAIRSTVVGNPLTWVVWDGPKATRGLLALRVGKWKVKIVHVLKERPVTEVVESSLPEPLSIETETTDAVESELASDEKDIKASSG